MAPAVLLLLTLAMAVGSDGAWCVCKQEASSNALQKTIDYACGAGADCKPILQNGPCFNPNTVLAHCSYAANSYYQRNAQNPQACDFSSTATVVNADPSPPGSGCVYPATPSAAGTGSGTPSNTPTTPGTSFNPGSSTTPGGGAGGGGGGGGGPFNPNSPTTGTFGLGPSGAGYDGSAASGLLPNASIFFIACFTLLLSSALALL